jgi:hypothetical protein
MLRIARRRNGDQKDKYWIRVMEIRGWGAFKMDGKNRSEA